MFDYDEIEEIAPSTAAPAAAPQSSYSTLQPGEAQGPPGFAQRAETDPLRRWFPLRHLVLLEEWVPPHPPGAKCYTRRGRRRHPERKVLCVGPPSARAADWAAPDAFGGRGTEGTGNALVQLANRSRDELLLLEYPAAEGMRLDTVAGSLAPLLLQSAGTPWVGVGVGVGTWVLAALVNALKTLGEEGARAAHSCAHLHVVGFPPPDRGLDFSCPEGSEKVDWDLAQSLGGPRKFTVPNELSVYHLVGDPAVSKEQVFGWFGLQPSLSDGATKGAYQLYPVQGDNGILRRPRQRTGLYWALANASWGRGPSLFDAPEPLSNDDAVKSYWEAMEQIGHGPPRPDGLFDEKTDLVLKELESAPGLKRFTNMAGNPPGWIPTENYCCGNAAALSGLDIRMYVDTASKTSADGTGRRTVCAVRFGNPAGISVFPGAASGVHGGAIQAAMDEVTALCCRVWLAPMSTTRKISHQIPRPAYMHQSYKAVCEIDSVKNSGALIVVKARLMDLLGEVVCITTSEMLDFQRMAMLQMAA